MSRRGGNRRARAATAAGITTAVLVAGGGAAAYANSRDSAPAYVTASVSSYPVVQTLQATGTTQPTSAATVSFAVSGVVTTVPVAMGDKVTAGQVLATLDTTSLKSSLATAQGQVANAELTLAQAKSGQISAGSSSGAATGAASTKTSTGSTTGTANSNTTTTTTTTTGTGSSTGTPGSSGSSHAGSASTASITTAQKLLLATVRKVDSALSKTKTDLALATTLCSNQSSTTTGTPTTTLTGPTGTPTTTAAGPTGTPTTTAAGPTATPTAAPTATSSACIQAQQLVLSDESALFTLQQGLSGQESALDKLLTSAATSAGTSSTGTVSAGKASAGTAVAGGASASTGGTGSTTVAVSAAQLAADQSAVEAAKASVAVAEQQLTQATIVSPFTGVVSSVGLTIGQQATAGSTTTAIDVIDPTGHGVTVSVDVAKVAQVRVGQKAAVVPDGSATALPATVTYVAAAPATGSTGYTVELAFTSNPTKLRDGIQAAVKITTAQAPAALAVPTSAVKHRGTLSYVLVLEGSTTKQQTITVGAVGAIYTQVIQGLAAGQRVVLADPNQAIPTNTITGRVARITGGVASTSGVLGSTASNSGTRPGG
jgi:multidrug efflux pump subunit AcrA (membrane-fusion protein)